MIRPCTLLMALALAGQAHAGYYDAAADFSITQNPNGVWSYGETLALTSPFLLFTSHVPDPYAPQLETWNGVLGHSNTAGFGYNATSNPIASTDHPPVIIAPGQLIFGPGATGQYADLRFTTSISGLYSVAAMFSALDYGGPDVYVLLDNAVVFSGALGSTGSLAPFSSLLSLKAGDTLDFKVGIGASGVYYHDSTGIEAILTPSVSTPEPSSMIMLAMGSLGVAWKLRRRN